MMPDAGSWTVIATVAIALINMVGSVLLQWIRAVYQVHEIPNGANKTHVQPPHG